MGGGNGAAITWGNGTAWGGNGFNHRTTDLGGYTEMIVRMSAGGTPGPGETTLGVQGFVQKNGFSFQSLDGGAGKPLPIDGQFHDLTYSLDGLDHMNVVEQTGINLFGHATNLEVNVDSIRFRRLETETLFSWENSLEGWVQGPEAGHVHSIVSTGATHGATALQIDRTSVPGNPPPADTFVVGSSFTTTNLTQIGSLVDSINNAEKIAFDVTYSDFFPPPTFTNFSIILTDDTGAQYQAQTPGIDLNGAVRREGELGDCAERLRRRDSGKHEESGPWTGLVGNDDDAVDRDAFEHRQRRDLSDRQLPRPLAGGHRRRRFRATSTTIRWSTGPTWPIGGRALAWTAGPTRTRTAIRTATTFLFGNGSWALGRRKWRRLAPCRSRRLGCWG